jgi:hypothetical protein
MVFASCGEYSNLPKDEDTVNDNLKKRFVATGMNTTVGLK